MNEAQLTVLDGGVLSLVEDLGRPGWAALGVAPSGAFDRPALALANRLVGNDPVAAGVEVTFGGLAVRVSAPVVVAVTGAPCPVTATRHRTDVPATTRHRTDVTATTEPGADRATATVAGAGFGLAFRLPTGAVLRLGPPVAGVRTYLAVRGGLAVAETLGSRSHDSLGGLGPPPLRTDDVLTVGTRITGPVAASDVATTRTTDGTVPLVVGPRDDWFTREAIVTLLSAGWRVRGDADRVGVRLDGPRLERAVDAELPSEPTRPGAVQVPPDGRPIVFGPDGPTTGGYPVIAVVTAPEQLAQLRPGDVVRFVRDRRA